MLTYEKTASFKGRAGADYKHCCSPKEGTLLGGDHAATASSCKLTCTTKISLYVPPEATTNGTVQMARNSTLPIWPMLRTID